MAYSRGHAWPLDRINLSLEGEGVLLGGYNSGLAGEESVIGKDYVYACFNNS